MAVEVVLTVDPAAVAVAELVGLVVACAVAPPVPPVVAALAERTSPYGETYPLGWLKTVSGHPGVPVRSRMKKKSDHSWQQHSPPIQDISSSPVGFQRH